MSESVQFWLDNKMSAGLKVAAIGDQTLVAYREKYYIVEKEAARSSGGKALRYSRSSLPAIRKRALRGESLSADLLMLPADDALPVSTGTKRERLRKKSPPPAPSTAAQPPVTNQSALPAALAGVAKPLRSLKKPEIKPATQAIVVVTCPHCNTRHDLPVEKGKNGKPFFMTCDKCTADFAVRFVPVMAYQAQVAGFR